MKKILVLLAGITVLLWLYSRVDGNLLYQKTPDQEAQNLNSSGFRGRGSDKTFDETYGVNQSLPISEDKFIEILKTNKLTYEIYPNEVAGLNFMPEPLLNRNLDISSITKVYDVIDASRSSKRSFIHYSAYVNKLHQVVYVENRFEYSGP
ncbi:MAG TPA: hypothetical protein VGO76_04955 [Luteibacter sp.]|jgi:hypothetical protein|nr:hypothetical protein [Luteibacter sp.]